MLVCGPFHSISNPPVGMAYLHSFLEARGIPCELRDLNIESRAHLLVLKTAPALVDELYSQSCRTYLAEAMVWSWHDPEGAEALIRRLYSHPSSVLREFWDQVGILRLTNDPALRQAGELLRTWLLEKAEEVARAAPDWVGFSTTITNLAANLFLARRLKELRPNLLVVMGGPEVTQRNAGELLASFPYVDAAIPPPAYEPLAKLLLAQGSIRASCPPAGVWIRGRDGGIEFDKTRCWVNLDELPPANWQGIDLNRYQPGFLLQDVRDLSRWYPTVPLHTSQGCSYNLCGFCYNVSLYPRFGTQSPQRVITELTHQMASIGSRGFFFTDFEFNARPERVREICQLIQDVSEDIRFYCWVRLDKLDHDLLTTMYNAGARQIFIGVEAVDDALLRLMRKGYDSHVALGKLQMLDEFWEDHPDLRFEFNLITNYPGESLDSVKNTLAQIAENPQLFLHRVAAVVEFMLHEGTYAFQALAPVAIGIMDPILPPTARLRSYRYVFDRPGDTTLPERLRIWSAIRSLVQRDA